MTAITTYRSYDANNVHPVPVISSFDTSGNIKPLYVRINGISYHVTSAYVKPGGFNIITTYNCVITDGQTRQSVRLIHYKRENVWALQ